MKVFLDSNVWVSGLATRGLSADVVRAAMAEHDIITSEVVIQEVCRVLTGKFGVPAEKAKSAEELLRRCYVQPVPDPLPELSIREQSDLAILASALAAGADVLITGDKDLLTLADQMNAIRILSPRQFWDLLRNG